VKQQKERTDELDGKIIGTTYMGGRHFCLVTLFLLHYNSGLDKLNLPLSQTTNTAHSTHTARVSHTKFTGPARDECTILIDIL
jgi:hypothetical protein